MIKQNYYRKTHRFIRASVIYAGGGVVEKLTLMLVGSYLARNLTVEKFSELATLIAVITILSTFVEMGQGTWLRHVYLKDKHQMAKSVILVFKNFICAYLLVITVIFYLSFFYFDNGLIIFLIVSISVFFIPIYSNISRYFIYAEKPISYFVYIASCFGVMSVFFYGSLILGYEGLIKIRLVSFLIGIIFVVLISLYLLRGIALLNKDVTFKEHNDLKNSQTSLLRYGFPVMITGLSVGGLLSIERVLLSIAGKELLLAATIVVFHVVVPLLFFAQLIGQQITPLLYRLENNKNYNKGRLIELIFILTVFLLCFTYSFFIEYLVYLYGGEKYMRSDILFLARMLSFYPVMKAVYQIYGRKYQYYESTGYLMKIVLIFSSIHLVLFISTLKYFDFLYYGIFQLLSSGIMALSVAYMIRFVTASGRLR
ncbi:hypothetical protein OAD42_02785 [Oceanospirillaceae bacterium]|nr:hypothetical protein [Oceanospirillaceae bacterium]